MAQSPKLEKLWQNSQIKLIDLFIQGKLSGFIGSLDPGKSPYRRIILTQALGKAPSAEMLALIPQVKAKLEAEAWTSEQLRILAEYYSEDAGLSLFFVLDRILDRIPTRRAKRPRL